MNRLMDNPKMISPTVCKERKSAAGYDGLTIMILGYCVTCYCAKEHGDNFDSLSV